MKQDAATVFPPPDPSFEAQVVRKGRSWEVWFPTAAPSGWAENDRVFARLVVPAGAEEPVPVVLLLHGLGATDHLMEERIAHRLASKGIASLLLTLPYHLERSPKGTRSGTLALRPDVNSFESTIRQSVADLRRAVDWAATRVELDRERVGVLGISLGAIVGALGMAVEPRLRYGALLLGGADIAHVLWHSSLTISVRDALRRQGWTEQRLRERLRPVEPLEYVTPEMGERVLLVGALFDTVVPAVDTEKLHRALGSPPMLWLETGHYGAVLVEGRLHRIVSEFFDARFRGERFVPPASIGAPTLRIGLMLDAASGLQVAGGMDLWRSNTRGDFYASGFLTTRGPALFAGWRGPLGFSPGLIAYPKRTVPGCVWHFIL